MLLRLLTTSLLAVCASSNGLPFRQFGSADSSSSGDVITNTLGNCKEDQKQDAKDDDQVCGPCVSTSYGYQYTCSNVCPICSRDKARCSMMNVTVGYMQDDAYDATIGFSLHIHRKLLESRLELELGIQYDIYGGLVSCAAMVDQVPCEYCGSCDNGGFTVLCTNVDGLSLADQCTEFATGAFEGIFMDEMDDSCLNTTTKVNSIHTPGLQEVM